MDLGTGALEEVVLNPDFWSGRRVFVTGHTGFKGAWMLTVLRELGAAVTGYALAPPTEPSMFDLLGLTDACRHMVGDVRDLAALEGAMRAADAEIVVHMAAQPLVRDSYQIPVDTYAVNVMGTVHVMDACRRLAVTRAAVMVTTDKCYQNNGWPWGYRENDRLGGHDPYSNSKAAAELTVAAYRDSYFGEEGVHLASVRAGNVIGGGDFAVDRLVPDAVRAFAAGRALIVRNPLAVRPWQHVLEPVCGYLLLAEQLYADRRFATAWNFGPALEENVAVGTVANILANQWGGGAHWVLDDCAHPHEAHTLKLDSSKARLQLGWAPRLALADALQQSCDWYRAWRDGGDLDALTRAQARSYLRIG